MTNRAEFLESALLRDAGFRHAFFTRNGGVSAGAYSSLSFSVAAGDSNENVTQNLERAAAALGIASSRIHFLSQVHGRVALILGGTELQSELIQREGDALVSRAPGLACGVRSADCVPVLLADRRSGAVAAAHAGWRGAVSGIVSSAVDALRSIAPNPDLLAAIGPHISLDAFEVSEDVAEKLLNASRDPHIVDRSRRKPHVDLRRMLRAELHALGLAQSAIDDVWGCTVLQPERFFSFRRDGKASGRHLSAIVPRL
ncbi:MAG TPA: peptidoglycan editing factor PgeF [Polyangiaceae bacterium]|nr:peptidoglycan editing factor PgeF [Polyangiaceae bacterium]